LEFEPHFFTYPLNLSHNRRPVQTLITLSSDKYPKVILFRYSFAPKTKYDSILSQGLHISRVIATIVYPWFARVDIWTGHDRITDFALVRRSHWRNWYGRRLLRVNHRRTPREDPRNGTL